MHTISKYESQYPLIWAVASDVARVLRLETDYESQYPLIWAVASDKVSLVTRATLVSLNTLSFGQ